MPGRPTIGAEPGQRYQVRLPEHVAEYLRASGRGSISRGILEHVLHAMPGEVHVANLTRNALVRRTIESLNATADLPAKKKGNLA